MGGVGGLLLWSLEMVLLEWSCSRALGMVSWNGALGTVVLEDSWNTLALVLVESCSWKAPGHKHIIGL